MTNNDKQWKYLFFLLIITRAIQSYGATPTPKELFEQNPEAKVTARSTFFITPKEVKQNYRRYHPIDLSVTKMDCFTIQQQHYNLQDLGNHWTATQPLLYTLPNHIGATHGLSLYDLYFKHPQEIRHYCMPKSKAYTHFNIVLANLSSFVFDGCCSFHLLPNWYGGINMHGAMTEIEWPTEQKKGNKIVDAFPNFDIFTHFNLFDGRYYCFTSYSTIGYTTKETGGIIHTDHYSTNSTNAKKFHFDESPAKRQRSALDILDEKFMTNRFPCQTKTNYFATETAETTQIQHKDKRRHFYLYHHYEFNGCCQLYHQFHYHHKNNRCRIPAHEQHEAFAFIGRELINNLKYKAIENKVNFTTLGNECGMKGDLEKLPLFYSLYYRWENIHFNYDFPDPLDQARSDKTISQAQKKERKDNEHYIGFNTRLKLTKKGGHQLHLDGEYLYDRLTIGYHKLQATYLNNFIQLSYNEVKHKVPYSMRYGHGYDRRWNKNFKPPFAQQLAATGNYTNSWIGIHPCLTLQKINNHIYYRHAELPNKQCENQKEQKKYEYKKYDHCIAMPIQATSPIYLLSWGGRLNFCLFSYWHFDHSFTFLEDISQKDHVFKGYMPPFQWIGRYYFARQAYDKKMDIEAGVNVYFRDCYYGDGYDIIAQQFYRQNKFPVQGQPIIDLFCNYRVSHLKISIKYSFINNHLDKKGDGKGGYFAAPFYPALKTAADIGIQWSFFD